ncbi:MAG: hypothetical protein A2383_02990 [Candidatus Pacebacteria bacterium RIFOXYB1_FULL_39_46]|nr:MAG: hypothetical protein A2182_00960 [Candidatus Pacebacteria bacterium RIFOXYA1_FULL_38_18]OGJ38805.1 MAG: hypothetical protein A2383_02990 [Candidatus Pacebacteria bacterium RIFOXYB1_FULL_39_46]OGJ39935.1 MAG: hypothetical protein A2582_00890 [Candidatus Pacebacteria bacterium RIFOXYD1_FULL_39_27]OGJ41231.1 MAG: hypothetical protein A2411_00090 [Candidatus Pacebacteria bacterium RIFOXYC1_FULL_39_21]
MSYPEDMRRDLNQEKEGDFWKDYLQIFIDQKSLPQVSGPFLGLGAGEALAERALARNFNLEKITLVDKVVDKPSKEFIESDLFKFLETYRGEKFGLVSAIGLEYLWKNEKNWQRLWKGLERVCKPNAYVVMNTIQDMPLPSGTSFEIISQQKLILVTRKT